MNTNANSSSRLSPVPQPDDTFWIRMIVIFVIVVGLNCLALLITWLVFWQNRRKKLLVQAASIVTVMGSGEEAKVMDDILLAPSDKLPIRNSSHAGDEDIITSTTSPKSPVNDRKLADTKRTPSRYHALPNSYPLTPTVIVNGTAAQESPPTASPERDLKSEDKFLNAGVIRGNQVSLDTIDENVVLNIPTADKPTAVKNSPSIEEMARHPADHDEVWRELKMRTDTLVEKPTIGKTKRKFLFIRKKKSPSMTSKRSLSRRISNVFKKKNKNLGSSQRGRQSWRTIALRGRGRKL